LLILVNPNAGGGQGRARWERLGLGEPAVFPGSEAEAVAAVQQAAAAGETVIVSASGDGGVHLVVNALMDPATDAPRWPVAVGAIGLGSSNDFHKPRTGKGIPIAMGEPARVDLGRVDMTMEDGTHRVEYFVLNSSVGAVAKGNQRYNQPTGLLALFKGIHPDLAIQWSSVEAVGLFENVPARVEVDGKPVAGRAITNLGVLKRVHFAGDMRYDTPVTPDDGLFDVNLCMDMTRLEFVRAMLAIGGGKFLAAGLPKTHHWRATRVKVVPERPTPLELDGEVRLVREAEYRLVPRAIALCGRQEDR
jgi:diacylglycerol kinase family enzyme